MAFTFTPPKPNQNCLDLFEPESKLKKKKELVWGIDAKTVEQAAQMVSS